MIDFQRLATILVLSGVMSVTLSCKTTATEASAPRHTAGKIIATDAPPWIWLDLTYAEHKSGVAIVAQSGGEDWDLLPENDPLSVRVSYWLDKIDALVRAPGTKLPHPRAAVSRTNVTNAFVAGMRVLHQLQFVRPSVNATGQYPGPLLAIERSSSGVSSLTCRPAEKGKIVKTQSANLDVLEFFARESASGLCLLEIVSRSPLRINFSEKCAHEGCSAYHDSLGIVQSGTSNYLTFAAAALAELDEPEFVFIVAHELAHFYRGHTSLWTVGVDTTSHPYRVGSKNFGRAPEKDASLAPEVQKILALNAGIERFIVNRGYGSREFPNVLIAAMNGAFSKSAATEFCAGDAACLAACPAYSAYAENSIAAVSYYDAPSEAENEIANFAVRNQFDDIAAPCLKRVKVGKVAEKIAKERSRTDALPDPLGFPDKTVWDFLLDAREAWETYNAEMLRQYGELSRQGIALYSDEHEADEIAGEILVRLGYGARRGVTAILKLLAVTEGEQAAYSRKMLATLAAANVQLSERQRPWKAMNAQLEPFGGLDHDVCAALFAHDWKDAAGNEAFVPLGDISDPHHSLCFRAYTLDRDLAAHRFDIATGAAPAAAELPWSDVQKLARAAMEASDSAESQPQP